MVTLIGTAGPDSLKGQRGAPNKLYGLGEHDILKGGLRGDVISGGAGPDRIIGRDGNDLIHGDGGQDRIDAGGGSDTVLGGAGNDLIIGSGEDEADRIDGGSGIDILDYSRAGRTTAGVGVDLVHGEGLSGYSTSQNHYRSIEIVIGSSRPDVIITGSGVALGSRGDDVLVSGAQGGAGRGGLLRGDGGVDTLVGDSLGVRTDGFWLQWKQGADVIANFDVGQDRLLLSEDHFRLGENLDQGEIRNRASDHLPVGRRPQLIYQTDDHTLWFDYDGIGGQWQTTLIATFDNVAPAALYPTSFDLIP